MRHWHTFGAFGDEVYELTVWEWLMVLFGREFRQSCTIVCVGKSKAKARYNNYAGSREEQLLAQQKKN